jgi:hypothetical protein
MIHRFDGRNDQDQTPSRCGPEAVAAGRPTPKMVDNRPGAWLAQPAAKALP